MDLGRLLERSARKFPDKAAIVYNSFRLTYREMDQRVNRLANALLGLGLRPSSRVGIISKNSHRYLETIFACAKAQLIATNFNWRLKEWEILRLAEEADVQAIFVSSQFKSLIAYLRQNLSTKPTIISIEEPLSDCLDYETLLSGGNETAPLRQERDDDVLMHIYTSGTTRFPKGVMLTHKNVVSHAMSNALETAHFSDAVFQFLMPMFHVSNSATFASILVGGTLVILDHFDPLEYAASIERERVTMIGAPPTVVAKLIEEDKTGRFDLSSLETITYGAAPMPPSVIAEAVHRFRCKFVQFFGMTEMSPTICTLGPEDHFVEDPQNPPRRLFSVGKPCIGASVKVVDEYGALCKTDQIGEILASGDHMMKGYYKMPAETNKSIVDGWYYTGDMGYFDKEGFLYLAGRKSDMIISGAENIFPGEVEECIMELSDSIQEVAVFGVPDDIWGEIVGAVIVRKPGSDIDSDTIMAHCKVRIASYKKPRKIYFSESLPKDANGKILRRVLRQEYSALSKSEQSQSS